MDHTEDVERLFSWLKAPMVHYREFAPQREIAEAVATWPVAHRAAVETGIAAEGEAAPQGDTAAKERAARERMTLPARVVEALQPTPPPVVEAVTPAPDHLAATLGERVQAAGAEAAAAVSEFEPLSDIAAEPRHDVAEPVMSGFEEPPPRVAPPAPTESYGRERSEPVEHYPARDRGALFAGEYRGGEREARSSNRVADRHDRSLDAVFARLSGTRDRLPDPRGRARTSPGLGAVFGRLR
jgi:hypothetical protein